MSENLCKGCVGACCRQGMNIHMTREEADFMAEAGSGIRPLVLPNYEKPAERGVFKLITDCGNLILKEGWLQCAAHEDPRRPQACREFAVGSVACDNVRQFRGIAKPLPLVA